MLLELGLIMIPAALFRNDEVSFLYKVVNNALYSTFGNLYLFRNVSHPQIWMITEQK